VSRPTLEGSDESGHLGCCEAIYVETHGTVEIAVDIRVRAPEVPDILILTDADEPLIENAAALGGSPSCTSTFGPSVPPLVIPLA
jgi:hypothetical protein